ncbi:MAG: serine hydrolase [Thermoleophilia bacterium]|nr:serine hydrolase [Thermoleophilia bacterium]
MSRVFRFGFIFMIIFAMAVSAASGAGCTGSAADDNASPGTTARPAGDSSWQSPRQGPQSRQELLQELHEIVAGAQGRYGISVIELDGGDRFGINEDEWFQAASTIKIPILAYLYQQIEQGAVSREDVMSYQALDDEGGTGSIQYGVYGSEWTVYELALKMMKESDNVAKNMFFRLLGLYSIQDFIHAQGSVFDVIYNETTPGSMANLLERMYLNEIASPGFTDEMFDLMTATELEDRLPRHLEGVRISHKTGSYGSAYSDAGIVFLQDRPFVICVYSDDAYDPEEAAETIGRIALSVYKYEVFMRDQARLAGVFKLFGNGSDD